MKGGFRRLAGVRRAPAGLEWTVLRRLPMAAGAGTLLLLALAWFAGTPAGFGESGAAGAADTRRATTAQILLISLLVLHWTAILTVALLCAIVWIAKGPAFVADAYQVSDAERPR